jgi:hypothetical protein
MARQLRAEARTECDRLAPLIERAREIVNTLEDKANEHSAVVEAGEMAAVGKLIDAIEAGTAPERRLAA